MACTGQYATAQEFADFWCLLADLSDPAVVAELNNVLTISAADIHAPLSAVGSCSCATPAWSLALLKKLNIIEAAVMYRCACGPSLPVEEKRLWLEWLTKQFEDIRTGKIDLCGLTGSEFPAFGVAERNLTPENAARIIDNRIHRTGVP